MVKLGFKLSSEEHAPGALIAQAKRTDDVGFSFGMMSDRVHPWIDKQEQAPFVWRVIGGVCPAAAVRREMLEEAIEVKRALWEGGDTSHRGRYFPLANARIY